MLWRNICSCFYLTWKSTSRAMATKVSWIASWILVHLLPWVQRKRCIPIKCMGCVHTHQKIHVVERYGNSSHVQNIMEKTGEDNWNVKNIITNHGFSKGSTWLKCSHWTKGCPFWLKAWAMKDTWFFWLVFLLKWSFWPNVKLYI